MRSSLIAPEFNEYISMENKTNIPEVDCGYNMVLFSGKYVNPAKMTTADIDIIDIAHGLSNICRFAGQCITYYSVAQHSRIMAEMIHRQTGDKRMALTALLHDGSEAYLCDLVRCVKALVPDYCRLEDYVQSRIIFKFNLLIGSTINELPPVVKEADMRMCLTERHQLISDKKTVWDLEAVCQPYGIELVTEYPRHAERLFLAAFEKYKEV